MATATTRKRKSARIDLRLTDENKALIETAAALDGMTVSEFIKTTSLDRSREIIAANQQIVLSNRDRDLFLERLDAPPAPNAALRDAAEKFRREVADGEITLR